MNELAFAMFKEFMHGLLSVWYMWVFLLVFAIVKLLIRLWEMKRLADSGLKILILWMARPLKNIWKHYLKSLVIG